MKPALLLLLLPALLASCATAPNVQPVVQCPRVEPVKWPAQVPSFTDRMQLFLSGKVPQPISYELTLPTAKPGTTLP